MNTNKILVGGIIGGVVFFLLGWLIWGIILAGYMAANSNQCMMKPIDQMVWWALILSNLALGFLLSVVFDWSNTSGWMNGAKKGAIFGLIMGLSIDLGYYSMSTMYSNMTVLIVDVLITVVMVALTGGMVGWAINMAGKKS
jgi:hypothetical protein